MPMNYVSVSAVIDKIQLAEINKICRDEKISFPVAIGYQVSNKSINQRTQGLRQPKFSDLADLDKETKDYGLITAVHYYTKNNETIISDLEKIIEQGIKSSLIQFNTLPPSLDILKKVRNMGFKIIFKVAVSNKKSPGGGFAVWKGENVQDVSDGNVDSLINQVYDKRNVIDYAMFDPSHGTNLNLEINRDSLAIKFGKEIISNQELNHLGLVYAGGINPNNVGDITRKLSSFFLNNLSIDVESGVRTNDKLDLNLVKNYLVEYRDAFNKKESKT